MKTSKKLQFGAFIGAIIAASAFVPAMSFADDTKPMQHQNMKHKFAMGHNPVGLFDRMDTNKDGVITREEVKAARDAMFVAIDSNKDGVITRDEMKAYHQSQRDQAFAKAQQARANAFAKMDKNNDGFITKDEWVSLRANQNPKAADRLAAAFTRLDTDKDGKISKTEFEARRAAPAKMPPKADKAKMPPKMQMGKMESMKPRIGKDGKITKAEWDAMPMPKLFEIADNNKDGKITKEEAAEAMKNMRNRAPLAPQQK